MATRALMGELRRQKGQVNMTPMIDVVFQLIIFFMLVMEISNQDLALLTLPFAENSRPDDPVVEQRLTLNISWQKDQYGLDHADRDPSKFEYRIHGGLIRDHELLDRLRRHGRLALDAEGLSEMSVLIRCDTNIQYRAVLKVLVQCMNARIWKIEMAMKEREHG